MVSVIPSWQSGNPTDIPIEEPCAHEFTTVSTEATCETCGLLAIGFCKECSGPVCFKHGTMYGDRLLCQTHYRERSDAATQRAEQEKDRHEAERKRQHEAEVEKTRELVTAAHSALRQARARTRTLAKVYTRTHGVMNPYTWNCVGENLGRGWYLFKWPDMRGQTFALTYDGRLFSHTEKLMGDGMPLIGHWIRIVRTHAVAVDSEVDFTYYSGDTLRRLQRGLESVAAAPRSPKTWVTKP